MNDENIEIENINKINNQFFFLISNLNNNENIKNILNIKNQNKNK